MNKDLTEIVVVLDKSGSMGSVREDTIGGFNTFLQDQKELPGKAVLTLTMFDTEYSFHERGSLLENVKPLNNETYAPGGMTALLDAVGKTINDVVSRHATLDEDEKPGKVIFVVITDGQENSSREITKLNELAKMVKKQEDDGWEIVFLGADIDAWADGQSYGFSKTLGMSKASMSSNMSKMSYYTATMRNSNSRTYDSTLLNTAFGMSDEDIKKQMDELKNKCGLAIHHTAFCYTQNKNVIGLKRWKESDIRDEHLSKLGHRILADNVIKRLKEHKNLSII
jgi:hypothetical protein